jgi:hypothetical protein
MDGGKDGKSLTEETEAGARTDESLSALDKPLLVVHHAANLDDIARHIVTQHSHSLERERPACDQSNVTNKKNALKFTCGKGTLRARSLIISRALRIM